MPTASGGRSLPSHGPATPSAATARITLVDISSSWTGVLEASAVERIHTAIAP